MNSKAIILAAVVTLVTVLSASVLVSSESDAEFSQDGFMYEPLTEHTVAVTGYTGEETELTVPSQVECEGVTYSVVAANGTFEGNETVESIVFPETLRLVDEYALSGCSALKAVVFPGTIEVISGVMLEGCTSLVSVEIVEGERYVSVDGVVYNSDMTELVYFPAGIAGTLVIPDTVESIGRAAFIDSGLTSVDLANVTEVGPFAFRSSALSSVTVEPGVTYGADAYQGAAVQWLIVEDGVDTIGSGMFEYCINLRTVTIPASVESIGNMAFTGCYQLTDVYFLGETEVSGNAFSSGTEGHESTIIFHTDGWELPDSAIGDYTQAAYDDLIIGHEGDGFVYQFHTDGYAHIVNYIGEEAEVIVPSHVDYDGRIYIVNEVPGAFSGNAEITYISLPATIDGFEIGTFNDCTSLVRVDFHSALNAVSALFFSGCTSMQEVNVMNPNGQAASVDGVLYSIDLSSLVYFPAGRTGTFTMPDTVQTVPNYTFADTAVSEVILGDGVTFVGDYAFYGSAVETVTLKASVEYGMGVYSDTAVSDLTVEDGADSISTMMFAGCDDLTVLVLPESIMEIADSAFEGSGLREVIIAGDGDLFVGMNAFAVGTEDQPVTLKVFTDRSSDAFDPLTLGEYTTAEVEPYGGIGSGSSGSSVVWAAAAVVIAAIVAGLVLGRED